MGSVAITPPVSPASVHGATAKWVGLERIVTPRPLRWDIVAVPAKQAKGSRTGTQECDLLLERRDLLEGHSDVSFKSPAGALRALILDRADLERVRLE